MPEFVDLVDAAGRVVSRGVPRGDADTAAGVHLRIVIVVVCNLRGQVLVHRRAASKSVDPGRIDHVCGVVSSGETPDQAARREAREELGVTLDGLWDVEQGVNAYGRYRHLMLGKVGDDVHPGMLDPGEVEWAGREYPDVLEVRRRSGEWAFVGEFFDDLAAVQEFDAGERGRDLYAPLGEGWLRGDALLGRTGTVA